MYECNVVESDRKFRFRAYAIIIENNHILFAKNEIDDYYYSVGGGVEIFETSEEAVIREVHEETGVYYEIDKLAIIHENFFYGKGGTVSKDTKCHELALYYLMKPRGTMELNPENESISHGVKEEMVWLPINELKKHNIYPTFLRNIDLEVLKNSLTHVVTDERYK